MTSSKETDVKDLIHAQQNDEEMDAEHLTESGRPGRWHSHKDGAKHWDRPSLIEPGGSKGSTEFESNSPPAIEKLMNHISSISEELKLIRKAIEGNGKIVLNAGISEEPGDDKLNKKNDSS